MIHLSLLFVIFQQIPCDKWQGADKIWSNIVTEQRLENFRFKQLSVTQQDIIFVSHFQYKDGVV